VRGRRSWILSGIALLPLLAGASAKTDPRPAHLALADRMVEEIAPANNRYKNGPFTVTWAGVNGAGKTQNESDCTTYVTALLRTAYGYGPDWFKTHFGVGSPSIGRYYDAAANNDALRGFKNVKDLKPGDLLISKYAKGASPSAAGHLMICDAAPVAADTAAGTADLKAYNVTILDCSAAPHANDTRSKKVTGDAENRTGIGRGTMQVYVNADGDVVEWSWSAGRRMVRYAADQRPLLFAKVPVPVSASRR
jgi:hypothetical protein